MSRLYLGNIPFDTRKKEVEKFFRDYGAIEEINMKYGYAFVEFANKRDADDAVHDLNGNDFLGEKCILEYAKGFDRTKDRRYGQHGMGSYYSSSAPRPYNTEWRVAISNISTKTSWKELKDYFRSVGEVAFADAHREHAGEGVVDFCRRSEMEKAVKKLDKSELDGRCIRVVATPRKFKYSRSRSSSPKPSQRRRSRSPRK